MGLADISVDGRFAVLAIDHRDSLRHVLAPDDPESVSAGEITDLKRTIVAAAAHHATGVMLEPEYSIPQLLDGTLLPGIGFVAALEAQGYLSDPEATPTAILDGWSVRDAKRNGAAAAKLLLPYRPDRPLARVQERVAREVLAECRRVGIPLVLEPLFYALDEPDRRTAIVLETVERFARLGPDLLKLPFPVAGDEDDLGVWLRACRNISARCEMPWALLSGGRGFERFREQVRVALEAGCSGFMVGRALWGEAAIAAPHQRAAVIEQLVVPRMADLRSLL